MKTKRTRMFGTRTLALSCLLGLFAFANIPSAGAATTAPGLSATINVIKIKLTWTAPVRAPRTIEVQKFDGTTWQPLRTVNGSSTRGNVNDKAGATRYIDYRARATVNGVASGWTVLHFDTYPALTGDAVPCPDDYIARAFVALNTWRAQNGTTASSRAPIDENAYLAREAMANSIYMEGFGHQSHKLFESGGPHKYGYPDWRLGLTAENVDFIGTPEEVIHSWDNSPEHHRNLLWPTVEAGFGCTKNPSGTRTWWTLTMGTPIISAG